MLPIQNKSCVDLLKAVNSSTELQQIDKSPEELSPFQRKFFRKITKYPNHPLHAWVAAFADKISGHCPEVKEAGMLLVNQVLKFRPESKMGEVIRDHLDQLVFTADFLNKSISDPLEINQAASILNSSSQVIKAIVPQCTLIDPKNLPQKLVVNPNFVADPRIKFYNLLAAKGHDTLDPVDDSIQMKVGFILADFRKELFQKLIPQDEKDRAIQELYLSQKLQSHLELIKSQSELSKLDESKVNVCYKRMTPTVLMNLILKGNEDKKFTYATTKSPKNFYVVPITKQQGYESLENLIDHIYKIMNQHKNSWVDSLRKQLQELNIAPSDLLFGYIDSETGAIKREGIKALLYSTQYLKTAE